MARFFGGDLADFDQPLNQRMVFGQLAQTRAFEK